MLEERFANDIRYNSCTQRSEVKIIIEASRRRREAIVNMNYLCAILYRNATRYFIHLRQKLRD